MKRLLEDEARCTGKYDLSTYDLCPDRGYCLRYQQFLRDKREGAQRCPDVPVVPAQEQCEMYLDKDFDKVLPNKQRIEKEVRCLQ